MIYTITFIYTLTTGLLTRYLYKYIFTPYSSSQTTFDITIPRDETHFREKEISLLTKYTEIGQTQP